MVAKPIRSRRIPKLYQEMPAVVAPSVRVTQKTTWFVFQRLGHNCPQIFLSRISAVIHFLLLGSIWRPKYERYCFCFA
jgi:hypothetical protein